MDNSYRVSSQRQIRVSLPFSLPLRHSRDKLFQALSRFSVLKATESWAGPGNEATPKLHVAMEAIEAESEGKSPDLRVYQKWKIPEVLEMCELVRKGPSVSRYTQEMHLYYTGGMSYVNVRPAIDRSLAKLAKRICDLRHRLAIIYCDINLHPFLLA